MTPLVLAILASSLLGSFHCAGMCGAFLALAVTPSGTLEDLQHTPNVAARSTRLVQYNLGRLVAYITLGGLAGLVGSAVDLGGALGGVQRFAAIAAALISLGFGLSLVSRSLGRKSWTLPLPHAVRSLASAAFRAADRMPMGARPAAIGLATGLLPCGWLWVFVATAAGTASVSHGMVVMASFWIGTLPVMVALGAGMQTFFGSAGRRLPLSAAIALVLVSIATIAIRTISACTDHAGTQNVSLGHVGSGSVCSP
jgi:sulfite exporter TauE/SafE